MYIIMILMCIEEKCHSSEMSMENFILDFICVGFSEP